MLLTIAQILSAHQRARLAPLIDALDWRDGAETAGGAARAVKRNEQADLISPIGEKVAALLQPAIRDHPVLRAAAQPARFSSLRLSRTSVGGGYGLHVDNPFMPSGEGTIRTDLSFTLFLSPPETYEGGELAIEHAGLRHALKPGAGDLVLYPSTSLHEVTPVTSGTRLVCIGWIESRVRSSEDREILFDLENLRASFAQTHDAQSLEHLTLLKVIHNLQRRFS